MRYLLKFSPKERGREEARCLLKGTWKHVMNEGISTKYGLKRTEISSEILGF